MDTELSDYLTKLREQYAASLMPLPSLVSDIPPSQILGKDEGDIEFFCRDCGLVSEKVLHLVQCYDVSPTDILLFGTDAALDMHIKRGRSCAAGIYAEHLWVEMAMKMSISCAVQTWCTSLHQLGLPARLTTTSELHKSVRSRHDRRHDHKTNVDVDGTDVDNGTDVDGADVLVLDIQDENGDMQTFQIDAIQISGSTLVIQELRCGHKPGNESQRGMEQRFRLIAHFCEKLGIPVTFQVVYMLEPSEFNDNPERTLPKRMRDWVTPILGDVGAHAAGFNYTDFLEKLQEKVRPYHS